ncbi:MAG: hypothetical protein CMN76_20970 [Spirochaetaceae bacterium]|nr:hypothetical protein [Spirochaetaceae bacterium]|tara:strand:+ start:71746 stop:72393 length:648 start_codon:yes stop_codon:yes gene_type:complete
MHTLSLTPTSKSGKANILIIDGHPNQESFSRAIAETLHESLPPHSARIISLRDLQFDPILKTGYQEPMSLEPDLVELQELIQSANHLVLISPVWWGSVTALMKGFLDRVLLPGFAFKYRKGSPFWDRLLAGRSASVYLTMDSPYWWFRFVYGNPAVKMLKHAVLKFCGYSPVRFRIFDQFRFSDEKKRRNWLELVRRDALRPIRNGKDQFMGPIQ